MVVLLILILEISGDPTAPLVRMTNGDESFWGLNMYFFSCLDSQDRPGKGSGETTRLLAPTKKPEGATRVVVFGESAALGEPPDREFGPWRVLDALLKARYPDRMFEVLPVACSATDSNAMYLVAKAAVALDPDIFVMYMGNNEVTGTNGVINPVWRFAGARVAPMRFWKLLLHSNTVRLAAKGVWLAEILVFGGFDPSAGLSRMASFDPQGEDVHACVARFQMNLRDMCRIAQDHGTAAVVSTVATNLRGWSPFYSTHFTPLTPVSETTWARLMDEGRNLEEKGKYEGAIQVYEQALKLDSRYAQLHFRLGHCYFESGKTQLAYEHYVQAQENDGLQARANNQINQAARDVVRELASGKVVLADSAKAVADASPGGVPGWEMFYDHVHMQFSGSYRVARTILDSIAGLIEGKPAPIPETLEQACSEEACAKRLALTPEVRLAHLDNVDHGELDGLRVVLKQDWCRKEADEQRERLKKLTEGGDPLRVLHGYEEAMQLNPNDMILQTRYLTMLLDRGDLEKAGAFAERVAVARSAFRPLLLQCARLQANQGKQGQALTTLMRTAALYPEDPDTAENLKHTKEAVHAQAPF